MEKRSKILEVPVLIVGAGPAGLTAALLLRKYGIDALTINRYGWTANTPRAHYQNQRSIEILRELGLQDEVVSAGLPEDLARYGVWTQTLAGEEFARIPTYMAARKNEYHRASPCPSSNISQHILEPIMAEAAMERMAAIRWQHEFVDLTQDADGVTVTVRDRVEDRAYQVRARYVIGADGARSKVAESVGITHDGRANWGAAVNVWFKADLGKYCQHRPGILFWTNEPGVDFWVGSGGFINVRPWNEWVLSFMYDPLQGQPDISESAMVARIRKLVGDPGLDVRVLSTSPWQMNALVAKRMSEQRVFLVGDAAHRHPPSGGLGSNTSMQDSYNLAWKLKAVVEGWAGPAILESYGQERHPVAAQVVERSMKNIELFMEVAAAMGFSGGQTSEQGWAAYAELAQSTEQASAKRQNLRKVLDRQQYHFAAHGLELGVRYERGALVAEPHGDSSVPEADPLLTYVPSTVPGAYLPHAWVEADSRRASTLDLCKSGELTLITGHGGADWALAAQALRERLGVPVSTVSIGLRLDWRDVDEDWAALRGVGDEGCVLVRPDRVVAWRSKGRVADPEQVLESVFREVLALQESTD